MTLFKRIVIIICTILISFLVIYISTRGKIKSKEKTNIFTLNIKEDNDSNTIISKKTVELEQKIGYLTIEKIGIYNEEVKEGVDDKVLKNNIGHFSNTSYFNGNVCFAGHNYSIEKSDLFSKLNKLEYGDSIIYTTKHGKRKYVIYKIYEIKNNDFSILENTKENIITLVTCVGNRKDIRLCVRAKEFKEVEDK